MVVKRNRVHMMNLSRYMKYTSIFISIMVIILAVYTIWDNRRFIVVEEEIVIDNLPEQLKGFRILQISDLHEKWFGENQTKLIAAINAIDYDAIVFTGDMLDSTESKHYEPFYSLIDGITNKENAWYVPGNTDPDSYEVEQDVKKSAFINGMEARGVQLLESVDKVSVGDTTVYFANFELSIIKEPEYLGRTNGIVQPDYFLSESYLDYQEKLLDEMNVLDKIQSTDLVIALNHYPVPDVRVDSIKNSTGMRWMDYDLIMAGHYHGGQIRLPILGAFFIPEPWYEPNSFFPPRDRVKGLWDYEGTKQYVSAGLGSSDAISFLNFRFLNPPEINVLSFR
ncbi:metallophosphoesterase [Oceanobacillus zhaokaii]|nr:metallophosphoesterase [Oceanobacillus zhaokaii]